MLFNSVQFLFYFAIVTTLFFALPHKVRWLLLFVASCYFYMAFVPVYILILFFTIAVDYVAGIAIEGSTGRRKKWFLIASILANCGVLAIFKYYNFLNANLDSLAQHLGGRNPIPYLNILLPLGLSFHTFQAMSYTIDVYRGKYPAERHLGIYALYVMFYPQLVAGPIERPGNLLPQLHAHQHFDRLRVTRGLQLMVWGMFKKVVIADRLASLASPVFASPRDYDGISLWVAAACFSVQVYSDFSGYSDIAIGAGQVMGIRLMTNFDRPFLAKSLAEFWQRWHISLSTWFRDYLYFPLGGGRVPLPRWMLNIAITFLVSGLWHGAQWTFVMFGAWFGVWVIIEQLLVKFLARVWPVALRFPELPGGKLALVGFNFMLVSLAVVFFGARTAPDAFYMLGSMFTGVGESLRHITTAHEFRMRVMLGQLALPFFYTMASVAVLFATHLMQRRGSVREWLATRPTAFRWAVYYAVVLAILVFGNYNQSHTFVYFQF
ncbi:MAG: MBOAT family protein [Candidatus Eisenbacteria bacterium]|nr:MBOAT family protein [Candidatus Eisenbacteria bacterium]